MASCKDCLCFDVCDPYKKIEADLLERCEHFKDRNRFIELPCKKGDTVYRITNYNRIMMDTVTVVNYYASIDNFFIGFRFGFSCNKHELGRTVFLTKEQAEQALKERENNG